MTKKEFKRKMVDKQTQKKIKKIGVYLDNTEKVELNKIISLQGDLKKTSPTDIRKLKNSLKKNGIRFPVFVWKHSGKIYSIDGIHRKTALKELESEGWEIPHEIPCVYVHAENITDYEGFKIVNEGRKDVDKGRIFISKAVLLLAEAKHSRDSDHLQNYIYDRAMVSDEEVAKYLEETLSSDAIQVPEYTFDCHTLEGKRRGKTKNQFFLEEYEALANKQKGLFDSVIYD